MEKKEYTFNKISSPPKTLFFKPAPVVIVEGIFIFLHEEIEKLIDLKIFIEAPGHLKLKRRILRDNTERGYDLDDVLYRYEYHVAPTFEKYIEPYKNRCDLIIPNNQDIQKPVDVMIQFIRSKLGN